MGAINLSETRIKQLTPPFYEKNRHLINLIIKESYFLARKSEISKEESDAFLKDILPNKNTIYLIAENKQFKQEVIGHILALPRSEQLLSHVASIGFVVHPKDRRKGIGSSLIEHLIQTILETTTLEVLTAEVIADNKPSILLLKKFQFKEMGRLEQGVKLVNNDYRDLIQFTKVLI